MWVSVVFLPVDLKRLYLVSWPGKRVLNSVDVVVAVGTVMDVSTDMPASQGR